MDDARPRPDVVAAGPPDWTGGLVDVLRMAAIVAAERPGTLVRVHVDGAVTDELRFEQRDLGLEGDVDLVALDGDDLVGDVRGAGAVVDLRVAGSHSLVARLAARMRVPLVATEAAVADGRGPASSVIVPADSARGAADAVLEVLAGGSR